MKDKPYIIIYESTLYYHVIRAHGFVCMKKSANWKWIQVKWNEGNLAFILTVYSIGTHSEDGLRQVSDWRKNKELDAKRANNFEYRQNLTFKLWEHKITSSPIFDVKSGGRNSRGDCRKIISGNLNAQDFCETSARFLQDFCVILDSQSSVLVRKYHVWFFLYKFKHAAIIYFAPTGKTTARRASAIYMYVYSISYISYACCS